MKNYRRIEKTSGGFAAYPRTVTKEVLDLGERKLLSDILTELKDDIVGYELDVDPNDPLKYYLIGPDGEVHGTLNFGAIDSYTAGTGIDITNHTISADASNVSSEDVDDDESYPEIPDNNNS